jgi:hypothetical protein
MGQTGGRGRRVCWDIFMKSRTAKEINEKHASGLTINALSSSTWQVSIISLYFSLPLITITRTEVADS